HPSRPLKQRELQTILRQREGRGSQRTSTPVRGKLNAPARSSITFTWHVYCPGFRSFSGTSNWNAMVLREASVSFVASTSGVSKTFVEPERNSIEVSSRGDCAFASPVFAFDPYTS